MPGAVVENLSSRKLFVLLGFLLAMQVAFFLAGGLVAPSPTTSMEVIMTKCRDLRKNKNGWIWTRPVESSNCLRVPEHQRYMEIEDLSEVESVVFVAQIPLPREGVELQYSPWFQWLLGMMLPEVSFDPELNVEIGKDPKMLLDVKLGYRQENDKPDAWKTLVHTQVTRELECGLDDFSNSTYQYDCHPIELFELGSNDYPFYLINLRLPVTEDSEFNQEIGHLDEAIHQNGGFTQVWLAMKTINSVGILIIWAWYFRRIRLLGRPPTLLEKVLSYLGGAMTLMNLPVEWLSLWGVRMPFMLLLSDLRQGLFYAVLASFWLIFTGEHLLDEDSGARNRLSRYWKHLTAVIIACMSMLAFDMCERGAHLRNPFYSIWATDSGRKLSYAFLILAMIACCIYICALVYFVFRAYKGIQKRRVGLSNLSRVKRLTYEGLIYRFKFLMFLTIVCAVLTVSALIISMVGEKQLHLEDFESDDERGPLLQYTSAFHTGVYGMWNIYVGLLLALYAPSHKRYAETGSLDDELLPESEQMTDASPMTAFVKPASD